MTRADWWVTAALANHEMIRRIDEERTAPDLLCTLTAIGDVYEQAGVALGAAVQALRADGVTWQDIAQALRHRDVDEVHHLTAEPVLAAERALHARIGACG